jgi:hypothetical protein
MPRNHRRLSLPARKAVQFSELSEVCVVEHNASERWYTGEDHQRFKRERLSDVVAFREQSSRESSANTPAQPAETSSVLRCPVGLEQLLSRKAMVEAHSQRKIVIRSVLLEQNRQRAYGLRDPDQIAYISVSLSSNAFDGAQKRGKFQEMAKFM